ncbi:3-oxoacyl-ACP synthase III family protein [Actinopolyspora saharensis]|uniref:3-oxoacyl-ACP synthase III family protein n=1 Tax=Actinopolyspora saharensis TaxID=995062 RepID=UPI003F681CC7
MTQYGLTAFGSAIGEAVAVADVAAEYTDDVARILEYGYRNIHRCPPQLGLTDVAFAAGRRALRAAELDSEEIDLVVLATTDIAEYLYWDAAAHVQHRLGAHRAEAVLIDQGCAGGTTCFDLVAGRLATHPEYRRALVIGANRTCDAYWNRMDTHSLLFSDGAAAAVAERGASWWRWQTTQTLSDGSRSEFFRLQEGGAAHPFAKDSVVSGEGPRVRDASDMMEHFDYDAERFAAFVDLMNDRVREVVQRACDRVGAKPADLARLVLLNDNSRTLTEQAARLDVPLERTNHEVAMEYGHFGAADHIFNLQHLHNSGGTVHGDLVALAGMGRGMHWSCTLLEA